MPKVIRKTITGMVLEDYQAGDLPQLERQTSIWDKIYHKQIPTAGFILDNEFATYKMDDNYLRSITAGTSYSNYELVNVPLEMGNPTMPYRSIIRLQKNQRAIFDAMIRSPKNQIFLNIPTASGKTVMSVNYIAKLQVKTIIICFKKKILHQWYDTFEQKTTIDMRRVKIIDSCQYFYDVISGDEDPDDSDIWLVTQSLITTFFNQNGWDMLSDLFAFMGIGFKVIDEAHRWFGATVKINAYTSVRTLYLSADYNQANPDVRKLFFYALKDANLLQYDEETMNDLKHIICVQYEYDSYPKDEDIVAMTNPASHNRYHWDHFKYTNYQLKSGVVFDHVQKIVEEIIKTDVVPDGSKPYKILILTNMISCVDTVYELLKHCVTNRVITRYHTKIGKDEYSTCFNGDIIVSTYQAFAEGVDITDPKIKHVISLNPVDPITANQSAGRCRPIEGMSSYYWMMVDMGFEYCRNTEARVTRYLANSKIGKITRIDAR